MVYPENTMSYRDDDDEVPTLSAETFSALQEFYREQAEKENNSSNPTNGQYQFDENWQLSQFWYDDDTIEKLSSEIVRAVGSSGKIALISSPSLYSKVKEKGPECDVQLFEFDERFKVYGTDFNHYDYNFPLKLPTHFSKYFDLVIADPPFLCEECLSKTSETIQFLSKNKIILCTGAVMENLAKDLLKLEKSNFIPRHKNNLANEFCCYSNYDIDAFLK